MKKIYQIPTVDVTYIEVHNMIATSPGATVDTKEEEDPNNFDVKGSSRGGSHNVWDEDWSR